MSDDYRFEIGQITMQTDGGGIVHTEDEAFATEKVTYYAEILNNTDQYLGPFELSFLIDGQDIGYGGQSHQGIGAHESFWAQGSTDTLSVGQHTLHIKVHNADPEPLWQDSEQTVQLTVLQPRSRGSVAEGQEDTIQGWAQRDLNLYIKDFEGKGVNGSIYVEINGGGHRVAEAGVVEDGVVNLSGQVWTPTHEGSLILTVDANGRRLTGGGTFDDGENAITKTYVQSKRIETRTFESQESWEAMVGATVSAGIELKVFSAGVEVTGEYHWGGSITEGREYEIWIAQDTLEDEERDSARNR